MKNRIGISADQISGNIVIYNDDKFKVMYVNKEQNRVLLHRIEPSFPYMIKISYLRFKLLNL